MSVTLDLMTCFPAVLLLLVGMIIGLLLGGGAQALYHRWRDYHAYWDKACGYKDRGYGPSQ